MSAQQTARHEQLLPEAPRAPRAPREDPRRLRVAEPGGVARRRPRVSYAIVAVLGALAIAGVQMMMSVLITEGTYRIADLSHQQNQLDLQADELRGQIAGLSSPQYLAANASAMGMVIDASPSYLRLSDDTIIGAGVSADGSSFVHVADRSAVANSLIAEAPLATDPSMTVSGPVQQTTPATEEGEAAAEGEDGTGAADDGQSGQAGSEESPPGPPSLDEGLPSPQTH